ncbi:MAG: glutathione S-transferase [Pseudomonadota bacterium]
MKLFDNPASPFCRKVKVLALETGQFENIELVAAGGSPVASDNMPTDLNPLGKIPTLVTSEGAALFDSSVICQFLDAQAGTQFYPQDTRVQTLVREAAADGLMDAAVLMVYEARCRPEEIRSTDWVEAQWTKVIRALDMFENASVPSSLDMGQIALGCALGYLDFRHPDRDWRGGREKLAAWYDMFSARPSMQKTIPQG